MRLPLLTCLAAARTIGRARARSSKQYEEQHGLCLSSLSAARPCGVKLLVVYSRAVLARSSSSPLPQSSFFSRRIAHRMLHSLFRASRDLGAASSQVMALLWGGGSAEGPEQGERAVWIWPFPLSLSQELVDVRRVAWPPMPPFLPSALSLSLSLSCRPRHPPPPPPDALFWPWMPPPLPLSLSPLPPALSPPRPNRREDRKGRRGATEKQAKQIESPSLRALSPATRPGGTAFQPAPGREAREASGKGSALARARPTTTAGHDATGDITASRRR